MLRERKELLKNIHRFIDMFWVVIAFVLSYYIKRNHLPESLGRLSIAPNYYIVLLAALCVCFVVFNAFSIYDSNRTKQVSFIVWENAKVVVASLFVLIVLLYLMHTPPLSRVFFIVFGLLLFVLLSMSKIFISKTFRYYRSRDYNVRYVLILGTRSMAIDVIKAIKEYPESGYKVFGCLEIHEDNIDNGKTIYDDVKIIGSVAHYKSQLLDNTIDELIIAAYPLVDIENITDVIAFAEELGIVVRVVPDFQLHRIMFKPETARVEMKDFIGLPTLSISNTPANEGAVIVKNIIDYICASLGMIILFPLFISISILIKITSPGPVFFRQERCGLHGRRFKVIKFRTMKADAETLLEELASQNEMDGPVFKIKDDPRITSLGHFLRKTSLDELPQLLNVVLGHMSLVGPRPPLPEEVEEYKPWQRRRLSMKPGLTCIWQVSGRNSISFERWMRMDLHYIDTWSLWLDVKLLFMTIHEVFSFNGR